jgi:hypothetical protein
VVERRDDENTLPLHEKHPLERGEYIRGRRSKDEIDLARMPVYRPEDDDDFADYEARLGLVPSGSGSGGGGISVGPFTGGGGGMGGIMGLGAVSNDYTVINDEGPEIELEERGVRRQRREERRELEDTGTRGRRREELDGRAVGAAPGERWI